MRAFAHLTWKEGAKVARKGISIRGLAPPLAKHNILELFAGRIKTCLHLFRAPIWRLDIEDAGAAIICWIMLIRPSVGAGEDDSHPGTTGCPERIALQVEQSVLNVEYRAAGRIDRNVSGETQVTANQRVPSQAGGPGQ